jgi:hypothetical protein
MRTVVATDIHAPDQYRIATVFETATRCYDRVRRAAWGSGCSSPPPPPPSQRFYLEPNALFVRIWYSVGRHHARAHRV